MTDLCNLLMRHSKSQHRDVYMHQVGKADFLTFFFMSRPGRSFESLQVVAITEMRPSFSDGKKF